MHSGATIGHAMATIHVEDWQGAYGSPYLVLLAHPFRQASSRVRSRCSGRPYALASAPSMESSPSSRLNTEDSSRTSYPPKTFSAWARSDGS